MSERLLISEFRMREILEHLFRIDTHKPKYKYECSNIGLNGITNKKLME